jgi:hypothetical protein
MSEETFTFRLPNAELDMLRIEARRRGTSVADLVRAALRGRMVPTAWVSMSAGCQYGLTVHTDVPMWCGGVGTPVALHVDVCGGVPA